MLENILHKFTKSDSPLERFNDFIAEQNKIKLKLEDPNENPSSKYEDEKKYKFIGKFINISYEEATLITNDDVIFYNGGVPKSSFLIATLNKFTYDGVKVPEHFMLLKVTETAPTPATQEMTRTYLEWNKKANPELDDFTKSDLKWSALKCEIVGQFYKNKNDETFQYASDLNFHMSPLNYNIYKPNKNILEIILNNEFLSNEKEIMKIQLGIYRPIENQLSLRPEEDYPPVFIDGHDLLGARTAMFGKTRLGKSNTVKLLIKNLLEKVNETSKTMGQLIFDVNGEYAYPNNQDKKKIDDNPSCIKEMFKDDCIIYSLTPKDSETKRLRINFYNTPGKSLKILGQFLAEDKIDSGYINNFLNVQLEDNFEIFENPSNDDYAKNKRMKRKILMYWAILHDAQFDVDISLFSKIKGISPEFSKDARQIVYPNQNIEEIKINSIDDLVKEFKNFQKVLAQNPEESFGRKKSEKEFFDNEEKALLKFLEPGNKLLGTSVIKKYNVYHSSKTKNFTSEILHELDTKKTVILDLSNATDDIRRFFSDMLSKEIFSHQEKKFVDNKLNNHYIQIYFEEAHNIFPKDDDTSNVYARFAKEGAKFNIGIVYSTQSPSTINKELLNQTENFFIGHISSPTEVKALSNLNIEFVGVENDILKNKQKGYMRVLTNSHRFVIPIQIDLFNK